MVRALITSATVALSLVLVPVESAPTLPAGHPQGVAFTTDRDGNAEVYVLEPDSGSTENLTNNPASDVRPSWSPFGRALAFVSDRDGEAALYVLRANGSRPVRVAPFTGLTWVWAPDGQSLAWVSPGTARDLWVTDVATGVATNLTDGRLEVWNPEFSPDGRSIVFESAVGSGFFDILAVPSGGGSAVNLTGNQTSSDTDPHWSPDGDRVAFVSQRDGRSGLYTMAADGSDVRRLYVVEEGTPCVELLGWLSWSPDGSKLAFGRSPTCGRPYQPIDVFVVPAGGGAPVQVARGGAFRSATPLWSPNGTRLAVATGGWSDLDLIVVDAEGVNPITLTDLYPDGSGTRSPAWSPDGSRLVFVVDPDATQRGSPPPATTFDIWTIAADGTDPRRLTAGDFPAWRPAPARPVGLVDPATGLWHFQGERAFYFGAPGDLPLVGDWDCDGVETPGLYRPTDGYIYVTNANATSVATIRFHFGIQGDIPLAGDWNGDGCDTVSVYRPSEARVFIADRLGADEAWFVADYDYFFGDPGDEPFAGDFDGDGIDTVGLQRESTGYVYILNRHGTAAADSQFSYGLPGDRPMAGDWTGDGIDTVAIYRPTEVRFYFRYSNTLGVADATLFFGNPGWLPVAGSFGGDYGEAASGV